MTNIGVGVIMTKGLGATACETVLGMGKLYLGILVSPTPTPTVTPTPTLTPTPTDGGGGGGTAEGFPPNVMLPNRDYDDDYDPNIVDVKLFLKWKGEEKFCREFKMDKRNANVLVKRINNINSYIPKIKVRISKFKQGFKTIWKKNK